MNADVWSRKQNTAKFELKILPETYGTDPRRQLSMEEKGKRSTRQDLWHLEAHVTKDLKPLMLSVITM